jgi:hypothetical protein
MEISFISSSVSFLPLAYYRLTVVVHLFNGVNANINRCDEEVDLPRRYEVEQVRKWNCRH